MAPTRRRGATSRRTDIRRYASTGADLPFSSSPSTGSSSTVPRTSSLRCGAHEDLARARRLLEPRGHVDRVPGCEPLLRAGDDLAGVDSDPHLERRAVVAHQPLVEAGQSVAQLGRGAHGAERVVLVHDRDAEDRHHGIADELLHRSAMPLDGEPRHVEVARQHAPQRLGIESLAKRRRAGHVAEQDRHDLALLTGALAAQGSATGLAEARSRPILVVAARTTRHAQSLRSLTRTTGGAG